MPGSDGERRAESSNLNLTEQMEKLKGYLQGDKKIGFFFSFLSMYGVVKTIVTCFQQPLCVVSYQ